MVKIAAPDCWMLAPVNEMGPPDPVCFTTTCACAPAWVSSTGSGVKVSSGWPPMQTGPAHLPPEMQALAFSQEVPSGALPSPGQSFDLPVHASATSQSL